MSECVLQIAGVRFVVTAADGIAIDPLPDVYQPFLVTGAGKNGDAPSSRPETSNRRQAQVRPSLRDGRPRQGMPGPGARASHVEAACGHGAAAVEGTARPGAGRARRCVPTEAGATLPSDGSVQRHAVHVLRTDTGFPAQEGAPLFASDAWSLHRGDGGGLVLATRPVSGGGTFWRLRIGSDLRQSKAAWLGTPHVGSISDSHRVRNPLNYPVDQLLTTWQLAAHGGLLLHAAGFVLDGMGIACAGVSGAGKTTLAHLLAQAASFEGLSDDRVIVRDAPHGFEVWGTPWPGEAQLARAAQAPLGAILMIARGTGAPVLRRLSAREALPRLLPTVALPTFDATLAAGCLATCHAILARVPVFEFAYQPTPEAARCLADTLRAGRV